MSCKYHLDAARSSFSADGSMALVLAQCRTHTSGALGLKLNILEEFSSSTKGLIFYLRWMLPLLTAILMLSHFLFIRKQGISGPL